VKLSAPPPPPPPSEQPDSGQPTPELSEPADGAPPGASQTEPAPKPIAWPSWFAGADLFLAALAILLAFMMSSFVARNTDLWLSLAAGQRLLSGDYRPGTDPFSYTATDRAWVNHSLLYDLGAYLLYRSNTSGLVLVLVKALAVALAFGLLIGLRRAGYSLWPWAAAAILGVIAAAPRLTLTPLVGSVLLLALTLFLLFRMPHRPNSWRFPIAIGVTFWIWAMVDQWFFVGPMALALVLLGELVQRKFGAREEDSVREEALGPVPDVPTLAKALAVGIIACMLNPHHVRVWELPFEIFGAEGVEIDPRMRAVVMGPLAEEFSKPNQTGRAFGYNQNGLSYAVLFLGGGLLLGLGAGRLRFAHLALWVGFALLSLTSIFAIPLFAVVAVPIVASQLNQMTSRLTLKSWADPKTRFVLLGSAGGRVLCVVAAVIACVFSWPGWMHPESGNPGFTRRVAWGIYSDDAMVRAAEQLQQWRQSGSLPPDARGLILSADLANYCAYFAPNEKVFLNGRWNHHGRELPDYLTFRKCLAIKREDDPDWKQLSEDLEKYGIEYVAIAGIPGEGLQRAALETSVAMWLDADRWSPWYLNGRSSISGWRNRPGRERPTFSALRLDPITLAFGKNAERLSPGEVRPIPPELGWEQEFIRGIGVSPAGVDEAVAWNQYAILRKELLGFKQQICRPMIFALDHVCGGRGAVYITAMPMIGTVVGSSLAIDELDAVPFLSLRAARRAIATDPDHPDGYYALYRALDDPNLPVAETRVIGQVTALRQYLKRLPSPERFKSGMSSSSPSMAARQLALLYLGGDPRFSQGMSLTTGGFEPLHPYCRYIGDRGDGKLALVPFEGLSRVRRIVGGPFFLPLDVARETLLLAEKYAIVELGDDTASNRILESIRELLKVVESQYSAANNLLERSRFSGGQLKLSQQFSMMVRLGLVGDALQLFGEHQEELAKEALRDFLEVLSVRLTAELVIGRLEDIAGNIEALPTILDHVSSRPEVARNIPVIDYRAHYQLLTYQKLFLEGNYAEAGMVMERLEGSTVGRVDKLPSPTEELASKWPTQLPTMGSNLAFGLAGWCLALYEGGRQIARSFQATKSGFFYRRGVLSLMEGDIAAAKRRFEQATVAAVKDWDLPARRNREAENYLQLIERAEKSGK
jgi:hypothetical protein